MYVVNEQKGGQYLVSLATPCRLSSFYLEATACFEQTGQI